MIPQLLRRTKVLRNNKQLLNKKTTTIDLRTIASQQGRLMCRRVHLSNHNMKIFPTHLGNDNYHTGQQKKPFVTTTLPSSFVASKTFHDPTKSSKKTDIPETVDILRQQFSDEHLMANIVEKSNNEQHEEQMQLAAEPLEKGGKDLR